jgi:hypothetical protein
MEFKGKDGKKKGVKVRIWVIKRLMEWYEKKECDGGKNNKDKFERRKWY